MNKKGLLFTFTGLTTIASLVVAGTLLNDNNLLSAKAGGELVEHTISMTTSNTEVNIDKEGYLSMVTYTEHGNKFECGSGSVVYSGSPIKCNTEDALFEVSEFVEYTDFYLYVSFEFELDVNEAENIAASMSYKLKKDYGWDATSRILDWSGLDAEDNIAIFTFDYSTYDTDNVFGIKFLSCDFTYSCSY